MSLSAQLIGTGLGVVWALIGGVVVYGILKQTVGIRLTQEEEFDGADLSIHKISATPDREVIWSPSTKATTSDKRATRCRARNVSKPSPWRAV